MRHNFAELLGRYLDGLGQAKQSRAHHDELRRRFLDFLRESFESLDAEELQLERAVSGLGVRGYIDALYGNIIFEFKRDLGQERSKGLEELRRYIEAQQDPDRYLGVLTDAEAFEVYVFREGQLEKAYDFQLEATNPQEAWLPLEGLLFSDKQMAPTAQDIVRRFGEKSAVFAQARARLWRLWHEVRRDGTPGSSLAMAK